MEFNGSIFAGTNVEHRSAAFLNIKAFVRIGRLLQWFEDLVYQIEKSRWQKHAARFVLPQQFPPRQGSTAHRW